MLPVVRYTQRQAYASEDFRFSRNNERRTRHAIDCLGGVVTGERNLSQN